MSEFSQDRMNRGEMMAGLAEQFMSNWTSDVFRERCAAQIESVRKESNPQGNSSDPVEKFLAQNTSKQLEEFVFAKSKTREDYIGLVAEILMMLRQHGDKPSVNTEVLDGASPEELAAAGITTNGIEETKNDKAEGGK